MIQLLKTKDYPVKSPKFNIGADAGIDFYVPEYTESFLNAFKVKNSNLGNGIEIKEDADGHYIEIGPHRDVNIPSGIYSSFPSNIALIGANKSGIATGKKLVYGAHIIDASYQGIIHLHMINTSDEPQKVYFDQKVVQFLPVVIDISGIEVLDEETTPRNKFYVTESSRGDKGFGQGTGLN